jgi:hypothetical protein
MSNEMELFDMNAVNFQTINLDNINDEYGGANKIDTLQDMSDKYEQC